MDKQMCGCGYGIATHPSEGLDGLRLHLLGAGDCCRTIATGNLIPKNFRMVPWSDDTTTEVCEVNSQTITTYTLLYQRMYNYDDKSKTWSCLKIPDSINSIGNDW